MRNAPLIYVIDDDSSIRWVLEKFLERNHYDYQVFECGQTALQQVEKLTPSLILCDIRLPDFDGIELLELFQRDYPDIPVVMMTGHSDLDNAVSAFKKGAFEYLPKPFDLQELHSTITRALNQNSSQQQQSEQQQDAERLEKPQLSGLIGTAPAMQDVFRIIGRLSQSIANVLITGASGTGKELVARALHTHSIRKDSPFIALNMAAIPPELIESELFGHEKGAFTGATQTHQGRFQQAHGGTLFLDEIGDMSLEMQARLLRVLATGEYYRVGGKTPIQADVRILAATHQQLPLLIEQGRFREDLFHRLNVVRIQLPDLNQRLQDVPQLAQHFLKQAARELNMQVKSLLPETLQRLQQYHWPGNVRQLENTCRWLTVMAVGPTILPQDLPEEMTQAADQEHSDSNKGEGNPAAMQVQSSTAPVGLQDGLNWQQQLEAEINDAITRGQQGLGIQYQQQLEHTLLKCALQASDGHKQNAAKLLGWGRNTVTRKLKEFDSSKGPEN